MIQSVHYLGAFRQEDQRDRHSSCALFSIACSLVQAATTERKWLASLIYTKMPYRVAKALVFLIRCCISHENLNSDVQKSKTNKKKK